MLAVQTLARRIRTRLHDTDSITYDDAEILDCINNGVRFIRRAIANIRPALLMSEFEGILAAGTKRITLEKRPIKIINVTAGEQIVKTETVYAYKEIFENKEKIYGNGTPIYTMPREVMIYSERALHETEMAFIVGRRSDSEGVPREFFLTGTQTINFFPMPDRAIKYTVRTVDDIEELGWADISPLNSEFDDFLIEYVAIRLGVGNEYDMTQESQMLSSIVSQIEQILKPPPAGVLTQSYWVSSRSKAGGYW